MRVVVGVGRGVGDEADEVRRSGVAEEVRNEDLQSFGRGTPRRNHDVEEDVGDDGPVEAEEEFGDEDEKPEDGGVALRAEDDGGETRSAEQKTDGADQSVGGFATAVLPKAGR